MFSLPGSFKYRQCENCSCIYLIEIPDKLELYYGDGYYSKVASRISAARKLRTMLYISKFSFLVDWNPRRDLDALKVAKFDKSKTLLDVGCGSAAGLVHDLRDLGYNATGVDPYISADVKDRFGYSVLKKTIFELEGQYDLVLFRHSLEHIANPKEVIFKARSLLAPGGQCVICVPVVGWAWKIYGSNWVQLDAPRHLCIYTENGMDILAKSAKMTVTNVVFDSDDFQFWASEGYEKGKTLSQCEKPSPQRRRTLRLMAKELNR